MRADAEGPRDAWLLPILSERLTPDALGALRLAPGKSYWVTAITRGVIGDDELVSLVADRFRLRRANRLIVSAQARERVPEELARRYHILPLAVGDTTLDIATANPFDLDCERSLAFATGRAVRMLLASPLRIAERIEEVYRPEDVVARLLDTVVDERDVESLGDDDGCAELAHDQPIVRLVDHVIANACSARASDVHFEPGERGTVVRYRVDGVLREVLTLPRAVATPLVSRIKIMSGLDIADRLRPQGGRAQIAVDGARIDLRVSTLPVAHGEKVVVRLLDARETLRTLDSLGFDPETASRIGRLLEAREGLVLVTGPTGSGKTTTLYALLRSLQERGVNIVTVEDPVEYRIPGIVQVQVNEKAGLTFASALRSILRQDPDIVLIGEVRDRETAAIAIQAALTGHLVFATLHTIDACASVMRMLDLGVERDKVAASLKGVIAQRLVRRTCSLCRGSDGSQCGGCGGAGYNGRLAIAEVVVSSPAFERAVLEGRGMDGLAAVTRAEGVRSLWHAGRRHVESGETTDEELRRVVEEHSDAAYDSGVTSERGADDGPHSTPVVAGVVDVYVLRRAGDAWRVLALQRARSTRCAGAWETVHGRIESGEKPEEAAVRELLEETGLRAARLYNATVQPFYLHAWGSVQLAVVFAAVVDSEGVALGEEHAHYEWLSVDDAVNRYVWPRSRDALHAIASLLRTGDAGPVEDVLRVF